MRPRHPVVTKKIKTPKLLRFWKPMKRLMRQPVVLHIVSLGCIVLAAAFIIFANRGVLASGSWNQTEWSGGVGSSTNTQYSSGSSVDTTTNSGSVRLGRTEKFSNGSLNADASNWSTEYLHGTPTLVQLKSSKNNLATTVTAVLNTTPVEGNTLFLAYSTHALGGGITPPAGYTLDYEYKSDYANGKTIIFRKVAGVDEPTSITVTSVNSQYATLDVYEFSGVSVTLPLDRTSTGTNTVSASSVTINPTAATSQVNELAFAVAVWASSITSPTWDNGFIRNSDAASSGFGSSAYKIISAQSAVSTNVSISGTPRVGQGFIATYKTDPGISTSTHESTTVHAGGGSQKLVAATSSAGAFTQALNLGDTDGYGFEAYVYTDGGVVSSSDAVLMADTSELSTTYTSVGGGWYKLTGTLTGTATSVNYGLKVKAGKTVYVDELSLYKYQTSGTLTSNIYDTQKPSNWGTLTYVSSGTVQVKARSSNSSTMAGATAFGTCSAISSGSDISSGTNGCVTDTERYIQYEITLSTAATESTAALDDITVTFVDSDTTPPAQNATDIHMYKTNGATEYSAEAWTNSANPYFSWTAAQDDVGGLGIKGYCLYLGTDASADPEASKGLLGSSPLDTESACPFAVNTTSVDLATADYLASAMTTSENGYYLHIKAIDYSYNLSTSTETFHFKYDNTPPVNPAYVTAPSNFISTKVATLSWATTGGDAPRDDDSGLVGLQYKIGASGTWYGDSHTGAQDATDLLTNDGSYITQDPPDFDNLVDGNNVIYFRTWDAAGNTSVANVTTVLKINTNGSPSSPLNVVATPSTNTANSFAFEWLAPASFVGSASNLTYCYTVNTQPTEQTCTFTAAGVTSLSASAYATQPGTNTFYVVAKDESGSINYATAASVDFTANTPAPGIPTNIDIADTSVKSTSNWRLVISWVKPVDEGAGISKYQIYRSTDPDKNVEGAYSLVDSTSGTSYVDSSLSSQQYNYKVKACDSANKCGAFSEASSKTPTGRYTTAPGLTSVPKITDISTRKATISWVTDRRSDSKIAFGVSSGNYFPTESYNSGQVTDHTIALDNLNPGTTYFYVARWTDEDGNTGQSSELTFATLPRPVVEDVSVPSVGLSSATIQYTTIGANKIKMYYGKSSGFGGLVELNTSVNRSVYNSDLPDLEDGTKYYYKINSIDTDGNEYEGTTLTFTTPPAPKITNLRFQPIENEPSSSQKVTWETNVPSTSELSYGTSGLTENSLVGALVTNHEVTIRGLKDDSQYRLIAKSRDGSGNLAVSDEQQFKTALDTRPPVVNDVIVDASIRGSGAEARGQIVVTWRTDELATSQVAYGEGASGFLSNSTSEDARLAYEHVVVISDLSTSRVYHVEPRSFDAGRNQSEGEQQVAIIGRPTDSVLGIIVKALQQVFGIN